MISETVPGGKKKHRRSPPRGILAPRAHARSTERSVRGVSHHNPFARRIRAVSVSSNRTGTRGGSHRSAGGSFPHLPLPTEAERALRWNPKRAFASEHARRRDAPERVDPGSHPGDPTKVPGRTQGASEDPDRVARRRTARLRASPRSGDDGLNFLSHSGRERFPRHLPCTPSPATPTADATRDPQTQVLVVVKDESRHAPIKKLLQEIGYKGANAHASQPRARPRATETGFHLRPRRSLESSVRVARTRTLSGRSARLI